jgi:UDP-GlcNAc3NAcA epimerase
LFQVWRTVSQDGSAVATPVSIKICSVVGARPQFIKAAVVSRPLRKIADEVLIHTGQHYDDEMSAVFFQELQIPPPDYNLGVGSSSHGVQTGRMLEQLEAVLEKERPDRVVVYGDTNSTLAGALAAAKLHIRVAHVEAGLRSFNRAMPEEVNRVLTDHISDLLFCPSQIAVQNLAKEGITAGVHCVGDVMAEALRFGVQRGRTDSTVLQRLGVVSKQYLLVTIHRAENTADQGRLHAILSGLSEIREPIIFPVHPRTQAVLDKLAWTPPENVRLSPPVSYFDMCALESNARVILTDSGGVQKEAYWLGVPCITLRNETEWVETVESGWNQLVGADAYRLHRALKAATDTLKRPPLYEESQPGRTIAEFVTRH